MQEEERKTFFNKGMNLVVMLLAAVVACLAVVVFRAEARIRKLDVRAPLMKAMQKNAELTKRVEEVERKVQSSGQTTCPLPREEEPFFGEEMGGLHVLEMLMQESARRGREEEGERVEEVEDMQEVEEVEDMQEEKEAEDAQEERKGEVEEATIEMEDPPPNPPPSRRQPRRQAKKKGKEEKEKKEEDSGLEEDLPPDGL